MAYADVPSFHLNYRVLSSRRCLPIAYSGRGKGRGVYKEYGNVYDVFVRKQRTTVNFLHNKQIKGEKIK